MIDGQRVGPLSLEQMPDAGVKPSTYIWCKGMPDWEKAEENADVCRFYRNRLYDLMHPGSPSDFNPDTDDTEGPIKDLPQNSPGNEGANNGNRMGYMAEMPTIEEIDARQDTSVAPVSMVGWAWIVTILCFFPTGILALLCAYRSKNAWRAGEQKLAHDYSRAAKMWTGVSFFLGVMVYAFLIRFLHN